MIALYGKKIGMTQVFDDSGALVPVTVLHIEPNVIVGNKKKARDGYDATIVGAFECGAKHTTKSHQGLFKNLPLKKQIFEVRGFENAGIGDMQGIEVFEHVLFVDVVGTSKGKGFQGVMKRHGAHGGPAKHGSKFHRTGGSTGHAATPSRVRKGTKMAGRMGQDTVTVQNLKVISIDTDNGTLIVQGAVPGANGGKLLIKEAKKKRMTINES